MLMKKTLILVAGPPATGKSYFINEAKKVLDNFLLISPDELKELYADKYGFNNLDEKSKLEQQVWHFYYHILEQYMSIGKKVIITEYPFSYKQTSQLTALTDTYQYQCITIRLVCDFEVLWQRRTHRDIQQSRHLSHLMTHYHHGDTLFNRALADNHISKQDFQQKIIESHYNSFAIGHLFEVDVTDYTKVDYCKLLDEIAKILI